MRTTFDRIRHALAFEIIALSIVIPAGAFLFHKPIADIGIVSLVSASIATGWNYLYNLMFDHAMLRLRGDVDKTLRIRVAHAVLFEAGLLLVLLPFIAWYLQISLTEAFVMDLSFAAFFLVYAFVYNWIYDQVFPIPASPAPSAGE
mgnify:FL=1